MEGQNSQAPQDTQTPPQTPTVVSFDEPPQPPAEQQLPTYPHESDESVVIWTASEYIVHHKTAAWYLALAIVTAGLATAAYFLLRDLVTTGVVVLGGVILGIYAARKPRQRQYRIDDYGIAIDNQHYPYGQFRSFSIEPEGAFASIVLTPLKRFAIWLTLYYDPADEDKIVNLLSDRLPFEEHRRDPLERFVRSIRF